MLPTALQALAPYRQFLCWLITSDDPPRKLPVSARTGQVCSAHDPNEWVDADTAMQYAAANGLGLAFSFQASDPFFFIDIDKAHDGQDWSELCKNIVSLFPGAAMETSYSGKGVHIVGRYTQEPFHGCKNEDLKLELYTRERFIALTGNNLQGDAGADHTNMLHSVAAYYFPVAAGTGVDGDWTADWTDKPVPQWNGPTDDNELIRRALQSKSARHAFGGSASFRELWEGDPEALRRAYGMDESRADAALAQHLAFWTGNDCARIERLMRQSRLYRDKWDREDYLPRTINGRTGAVRRQMEWLQDKAPEIATVPVTAPTATDYGGGVFVNPDQQRDFFKGCVYIRDVHRIYTPDGDMLKKEQFDVTYGGFLFALDKTNERTTKSAWDAFTQSQSLRFPKAHATCFRPEYVSGALIEEEARVLLNIYVPIETKRIEGDPTLFLEHAKKLFPKDSDRRILLTYMAACVQMPGRKFQWWPVLQGVEGDGKTLFLRIMSHCIGHRYTHLPNADDIARSGGKFNSWLRNKLFVGMEEVCAGDRRDFLEVFKPNVTNDRLQIEGKGVDQVMGDNRANGMMLTNHKDGVPITLDQRRYALMFSAMQTADDLALAGMDNAYFNRMYDWLKGEGFYAQYGVNYGYAICNHYLRSIEIDSTINLMGRAPHTSSTLDAVKSSYGIVEQEIEEAVARGEMGFKGGWISSTQLDVLLERKCRGVRLSQEKKKKILNLLQYDWHPWLRDGRVNNTVMPDGNRTRLFIRRGHDNMLIRDGAEIAAAYTKAQLG